jgi:hypothetical protein
MDINPKILYNKDGEKEQVTLSYNDFMKLIERIEDLEDLISLRETREEDKNNTYLSKEEIMKKYNYTPKKDRDKEDLPERKTQ